MVPKSYHIKTYKRQQTYVQNVQTSKQKTILLIFFTPNYFLRPFLAPYNLPQRSLRTYTQHVPTTPRTVQTQRKNYSDKIPSPKINQHTTNHYHTLRTSINIKLRYNYFFFQNFFFQNYSKKKLTKNLSVFKFWYEYYVTTL